MLKKCINNKRFLNNLSIIAYVLIGIGLVYAMEYNIGTIERTYVAEENVYAYPSNIGFRWSSILGMFASILFQLALFKLFCCRKEWRLFAWSSGWLIYSIIVYRNIVSSSRLSLFWMLQDNGYIVGFEYLRLWNYIEVTCYALIGIMVFTGLYKWLLESDNKNDGLNKIFAFLVVLIGGAVLILRSFTNIWYIILCVITSVSAWFVLKYYEKVWHQKGMDDVVVKERGMLDILLDVICLDDEEFGDELEDEISMPELTLDMLLDYAEHLDNEPFDDYTRYRYMVMMIKRLKEIYSKEDDDEGIEEVKVISEEKQSSYLAKIISLDKYKKDKK